MLGEKQKQELNFKVIKASINIKKYSLIDLIIMYEAIQEELITRGYEKIININ